MLVLQSITEMMSYIIEMMFYYVIILVTYNLFLYLNKRFRSSAITVYVIVMLAVSWFFIKKHGGKFVDLTGLATAIIEYTSQLSTVMLILVAIGFGLYLKIAIPVQKG